ncbi:fibronectin type III domain-containing protein [Actinoplanes sp. NPDC051851]|uniref:fibronectin type III domain-containing protein n=1 Tax=Actinoplanes sp. NPDC051851 TaxID=3154753 RepID=UPI00344356FC
MSVAVLIAAIWTIAGSPGVAAAVPRRSGTAALLIPATPPTVYVANYSSNNFSVVDLDTSVTQTVTPGGSSPEGGAVVLSPVSSLAYLMGGDEVEVLDRTTNTVVDTITVPGGQWLAEGDISDDGRWLYGADYIQGAVYKIDTVAPYAVTSYPVVAYPCTLMLDDDRNRLYVSSNSTNEIEIYDTTTMQQVPSSPVSLGTSSSYGISLTPDRTRILAALTGDVVVSINTTTYALTTLFTLPSGASPRRVLFSPDGGHVYTVGNAGEVWEHNASTYALEASVTAAGVNNVFRAAIDPRGTAIYLPGSGSTIVPIDLTTGSGSVLGTVGAGIPVAGSSWKNITVSVAAAPAAPTITNAVPGSGQVTLSFTDGLANGRAITGHTVSWPGGSQACPATSPCVVTGLSNRSYTFTLHATNAVGDSPESASRTVSLGAVPDPPTITAAVPGDGQATLRFRDGAANGSWITGHMANFAGGPVSCPSSPCVITGLVNGTGYTFTVQAMNAVGNSAESEPSAVVTPRKAPVLPGVPLRLAAIPGTTSVRVSFTEPSGTVPVTGYEVSVDGGEHWAQLANHEVTGLTPGTAYRVTVRAVGTEGAGPAATPVAVVTRLAAVGAPVATARTSSSTVRWNRADGAGITGYTVRANPGPAWCSTTAVDTDCVIGGTAGTAYTFTVTVRGKGGAISDPSKPSNQVTPATPGLPSRLPADAQPVLTTTKGKVASALRGQRMTLVGTGFAPWSTVRVVIYGKARLLATSVTDAQGRLTRQIVVPDELTLNQKHTLMAAGVDPDGVARRISMTFTAKG